MIKGLTDNNFLCAKIMEMIERDTDNTAEMKWFKEWLRVTDEMGENMFREKGTDEETIEECKSEYKTFATDDDVDSALIRIIRQRIKELARKQDRNKITEEEKKELDVLENQFYEWASSDRVCMDSFNMKYHYAIAASFVKLWKCILDDEAEVKQFEEWIAYSDKNTMFFKKMINPYWIKRKFQRYQSVDVEANYKRIKKAIEKRKRKERMLSIIGRIVKVFQKTRHSQ